MTIKDLLNLILSSSGKIKVCHDSRQITAGDCFVAIRGVKTNGHDFIQTAIKNGADFIVCEETPADLPIDITPFVVENSRNALAILAQAQYHNPSEKLINLAVTGTNGKTSVAYLVRSIMTLAGVKCGLISTVEYDTCIARTQAHLTTPDATCIAQLSAEMVQVGAKYMVTEASSHALSQNRLDGIPFKAAAFTNLTGDHLDYHETMDQYLAAKMMLFQTLEPSSVAVLNRNEPACKKIADSIKTSVLWYGIDCDADLKAEIVSMDALKTVYLVNYKNEQTRVKTSQLGLFNVSNQLAAAGLCLAAGFSLEQVAEGIEQLESVPGRLQRIESEKKITVLIDYAHTDDALLNVLQTLKPLCKGKLTVVFGCGGDRDKSKRPRMAAAAEAIADIIYVTSDNPRTENPDKIIKDIMTGFKKKSKDRITIEADRKTAVELAIQQANENDIILIAGKGHEDYQIIGTDKIYFNDLEIAQKALEKRP